MRIVLEELFGITELPFLQGRLKIKPTVLKKEHTLREFIEKTKPGFFSTAVPLEPYSLSEELAFFQDAAKQTQMILHFYDPAYTSIQNLNRVRNLLTPDLRLIPIPFDATKGNKAELIYLIHTLTEWLEKQEQHLTYEKILIHTQYFKSRCTPWSFVAEVGPFAVVKKHRSMYKPPAKATFKQVYTQEDGKLKVHKTGELSELWQQILAAKTEGKQVWVVRKGVTVDLPGSDIVVDLENQTLPSHIPYVQAIFAPTKMSSL
ncbi:hypothetical protein NDK47_26925 [Brevibacillus ruminantium]|uniref:Uncharacterized protein n=1 Tax=Brevibacillus ruminantium TaxID=2950604 RepID=A0ABY4WK13_9BACL|nr:hypothetical protein [Brevibacillus ruminantium]USG65689.1 hypothetical protein NDK47_26925 [Brevibacillus ruminantium]